MNALCSGSLTIRGGDYLLRRPVVVTTAASAMPSVGSDNRGLRCYSRTRGNQSAIDGMKIKSATKTKSATKNGSVPM
jgi:hypothetical protein